MRFGVIPFVREHRAEARQDGEGGQEQALEDQRVRRITSGGKLLTLAAVARPATGDRTSLPIYNADNPPTSASNTALQRALVFKSSCMATQKAELDGNLIPQHAHKIRVAAGDRDLAHADAEPGADRGKLREIAVGAERER